MNTTIDFQATLAFAKELDEQDQLSGFRAQYLFPQHKEADAIYFCGNSLGLQPKNVADAITYELDRWQRLGVEGHFNGEPRWIDYHKALEPQSAHVVGALPEEIIIMNTLTVNLHLMMVSFYRPTSDRYKIIMEAGAFPSDQYAVESQIRFHGFNPEDAIIEVKPREGEELLRTEDIVATIEREGAQVALVLFGGINYYTGQFFDLGAITEAGHRVGAKVGFDLAHAAGNVPLKLHDWGADFAVWCSYKYLNAGPGGPSGAFIHERHIKNASIPRFAGWWGHDTEARFLMRRGFVPIQTAEGWQLSNAPILAFAPHKVSLDLFMEATMPKLREKSIQLTGYLEFLIEALNQKGHSFRFITPTNPEERGAQLSFYVEKGGKRLFDYVSENGVICDWREDNLSDSEGGVIRIAPTPMYNTFEDVYRFVGLLERYG